MFCYVKRDDQESPVWGREGELIWKKLCDKRRLVVSPPLRPDDGAVLESPGGYFRANGRTQSSHFPGDNVKILNCRFTELNQKAINY